MRLFLIRHGETVDNVAGIYAGSRDSHLTNHGFQQATRLGRYFHFTGVRFTHIFSSHLQRAVKTAELIRAAQERPAGGQSHVAAPEVVRLSLLMEQDFGFYEGKPFYARTQYSNKSGEQAHRAEHKDDPEFVDVESKEVMAKRMDTFLDEHLLPIIQSSATAEEPAVAIVSHGVILSVLWRCLLQRLPPKSVSYVPELLASRKSINLEHLGGYSNTGYLELQMTRRMPMPERTSARPATDAEDNVAQVATVKQPTQVIFLPGNQGAVADGTHDRGTRSETKMVVEACTGITPSDSSITLLDGWTTMIKVINGKDHLIGLKRTAGGVGSARHDEGQPRIDSFFKRRKVA